jgi:hypothetical protein
VHTRKTASCSQSQVQLCKALLISRDKPLGSILELLRLPPLSLCSSLHLSPCSSQCIGLVTLLTSPQHTLPPDAPTHIISSPELQFKGYALDQYCLMQSPKSATSTASSMRSLTELGSLIHVTDIETILHPSLSTPLPTWLPPRTITLVKTSLVACAKCSVIPCILHRMPSKVGHTSCFVPHTTHALCHRIFLQFAPSPPAPRLLSP